MSKYAVIRNDESVLSQTRPGAPCTWLDYGVTLATDWRYAVLFDTRRGAEKSAFMNGATVHVVGDYDQAQQCA